MGRSPVSWPSGPIGSGWKPEVQGAARDKRGRWDLSSLRFPALLKSAALLLAFAVLYPMPSRTVKKSAQAIA